jgi:hypothetical protein
VADHSHPLDWGNGLGNQQIKRSIPDKKWKWEKKLPSSVDIVPKKDVKTVTASESESLAVNLKDVVQTPSESELASGKTAANLKIATNLKIAENWKSQQKNAEVKLKTEEASGENSLNRSVDETNSPTRSPKHPHRQLQRQGSVIDKSTASSRISITDPDAPKHVTHHDWMKNLSNLNPLLHEMRSE